MFNATSPQETCLPNSAVCVPLADGDKALQQRQDCAGSYLGKGVEASINPPNLSVNVGAAVSLRADDSVVSITDRLTVSGNKKKIVVDTVELEDIKRDADRDIPRYNTSNHWRFENRARPDDYETVEQAVIAKHWISELKPDARSFTINEEDVGRLQQIRDAYHLLGRIPGQDREWLEDLAQIREPYKTLDKVLKGDSFFVRTDYASLKYGRHGNKIYHQLHEVFESIVTSWRSHSPLGRGEKKENLALYLIPWQEIDPDFEFRAFVCDNNLTAVSQQNIYQKNETLCQLDENERSKIIDRLMSAILIKFESSIKPVFEEVGSYVVDLSVKIDSEGRTVVYFIEVNPFGKDNTSGSSAYSWIEDAGKLHGRDEGIVHFRYVT